MVYIAGSSSLKHAIENISLRKTFSCKCRQHSLIIEFKFQYFSQKAPYQPLAPIGTRVITLKNNVSDLARRYR